MAKIALYQEESEKEITYTLETSPIPIDKRIALYGTSFNSVQWGEGGSVYFLPTKSRAVELEDIKFIYKISEAQAQARNLDDMGTPEDIINYFNGKFTKGRPRKSKLADRNDWFNEWNQYFPSYAKAIYNTILNYVPSTDEGWSIRGVSVIEEYPKTISRGPYSFSAQNAEQETYLKDFLGIEPAGVDLDTYLAGLNREENRNWNDYWRAIWIRTNRPDLMQFTFDKADEWAAKIPEPEPEKTWWEKLIDLAIPRGLRDWLVERDLYSDTFKLVTGEEPSDEIYEKWKAEMLDWIPFLDIITKLRTGKNLKGETQEFGTADDWLEIIIMGAGLIIPGQADEIAAKTAVKTISKTEAARLTSQLGLKETVARLVTRVKANPTTSSKLLSKFPPEVRDAVFAGLYKTGAGREAAYALGKTGFFDLIRPWWKTTLGKAGIATGIAGLLVSVIGSYPFAGFLKEESLQTLGFGVMAAKENKDIVGLRKALDQQASILDINVWEKILGLIPFANVLTQLDDFYAAAKTKLEIDEAGFEGLKEEWEIEAAPKGTLIVSPSPADAEVNVDKLPYVTSAFEEIVPVGTYHALVTKFGYVSQDKNLEVNENEITEWRPTLEKTAVPEPLKAKLTISVTPSDAIISVANHPEITKSDTYEVLPGSYTLDFSKEGYESARRTVYLSEGETEIVAVILSIIPPIIPPEEVRGTLTISITPEDALIEVAGEEEITTSGTYELLPGSYSIRASKEDFITDIKTAFVKEDEDTAVSFILKAKEPVITPTKKATITITSEPTDAQVYLNGEYQWTTTPYTLMLEKGFYWIRIQKENYYPVEVEAEIEEGEVSEIPFILEAIPEPEIPPEPYYPETPYYPDYVPPEPYIPYIAPTPPAEIPPYDYDLLYPAIIELPEYVEAAPSIEKELMINIETTGLMPTDSRIYSIAILDLTTPDAETQIMVSNDEEDLIRAFLGYFETANVVKLVGYNLSFDYRFIFTKMMKYRISSKAFRDIELRDIMQIMKQVKEEFVFGTNKNGSLDEWGKMILGKGKYGSQELMLRKYLAGDFDYVRAFQNRQIELTKGLYDLARFCSLESFSTPASPISESILTELSNKILETPKIEGNKICPVCKAYNPLSASVCEICGAAI